MKRSKENERLFSLELFIAKFLRYGVLLAGLLLFVGWMMQIDFQHNTFAAFSQYRPNPLSNALHVAFAEGRWGLLIAYAGLGVLISLPIIRVALTALVFLSEKDYALAACAGLVLIGLATSFALGFTI